MATADEQQTSSRASPNVVTRPALPAGQTGGREGECGEPPIASAVWQDLEARWKAILGIEANMDALRASMESLLIDIEASSRKTLTMEEKTYALRADIARWEQAKKRVHYAVPKMKEFIHRAIWAVGAPERKRLQEIYQEHIQPQIPFPQLDVLLKQLEELQKDRQVLSALGKSVYQECRGISAEVQGALKSLQTHAGARRIKGGSGSKRGFFK